MYRPKPMPFMPIAPNYYFELGLYETYLIIHSKEYSSRICDKESWIHQAPWYYRMRHLMQLTNE